MPTFVISVHKITHTKNNCERHKITHTKNNCERQAIIVSDRAVLQGNANDKRLYTSTIVSMH